jgi:ribonuclease J
VSVTLTVYDGAATIGGNKILLEDGDTGVFLDFGTPFHTRGLYFEEFLVPRSRTGLLDLIHMGLLPPLAGVYRADMVDHTGRVWERAKRLRHYREVRADAVLLSHAHMDHCGYISFLDTKIPVVATCMTAYLAKAIQDCAAHQFEGEMCYAVPKVAGDEGAIGAGRHKEFPYDRRSYLIADKVCDDPDEFWNLSPSASRGRHFAPRKLGATTHVGRLPVRFFPVDHSIYGAAAIAVETSEGWVVYTGDLRRHGAARAFTDAFMGEAASLKPVALLCEGTNIDWGPGATEEQVAESCLHVAEEATGQFVVADFGPRNVERLLTFLEIARRTGRRLAVTEKDAYLLTAMHVVDSSIPTPRTDQHMTVYRRALLKPQIWVEHVREWYPDEVVASAVHAHPGDYICCFSFFDINELIDIDPSGGCWLYSASEPHDEEQQFEMTRLRHWLDLFKLRSFGLDDTPSSYHSSGHISGPELQEMIHQIAPKRLIPIHTMMPDRFLSFARDGTEATLPDPGMPLRLA